MRIRRNTLWRVPVFCLAAGWITFYLSIYMGWFFVVKTTGPDGVVDVSIDPLRSALVDITLFLLVLLVGGLWFFRSMTKAEIAFSAAILIACLLAVNGLELLLFPNFPVALGLTLAKLQNWNGTISALLYQATDQLGLSALVSSFAPLLFVPFGKSEAKQARAE
ncbi:MAG: hypothetical protein HFF50_06595 [Lawsonibacter sp.]|nr:hypothetical protein [Lawsonibacter sp.]